MTPQEIAANRLETAHLMAAMGILSTPQAQPQVHDRWPHDQQIIAADENIPGLVRIAYRQGFGSAEHQCGYFENLGAVEQSERAYKVAGRAMLGAGIVAIAGVVQKTAAPETQISVAGMNTTDVGLGVAAAVLVWGLKKRFRSAVTYVDADKARVYHGEAQGLYHANIKLVENAARDLQRKLDDLHPAA